MSNSKFLSDSGWKEIAAKTGYPPEPDSGKAGEGVLDHLESAATRVANKYIDKAEKAVTPDDDEIGKGGPRGPS